MSQRISFSLVIALLLGWGVMSLLIFRSSNELMNADILAAERSQFQPRGVKLKIDVDKKVYGQSDPILFSLRNDSSKDVWISAHADGCTNDWWLVEVLQNGENWIPVALQKTACPTTNYGHEAFARHTILTGEWLGLVPAEQLGDVFRHATTGTYRLRVPYLIGQDVAEAGWSTSAKSIASASFTIQ